MPTNNFPGIGYKYGKDYNFFQKIDVTSMTFGGHSVDGYQPDMGITFPTTGLSILNEGSGVVEFSFTGLAVHGELNSGLASAGMSFDNRSVSRIWFRVKQGYSGPIKVSVSAW